MDMTFVLGLHKFCLQANTDHHGPSNNLCIRVIVIVLPLSTVTKTFYFNDSKIREFEMNYTRTPLLHM